MTYLYLTVELFYSDYTFLVIDFYIHIRVGCNIFISFDKHMRVGCNIFLLVFIYISEFDIFFIRH